MTVLCVFNGGAESDMKQKAYCKYSSADLWSALDAFTVAPAKRNLAPWGRRMSSFLYRVFTHAPCGCKCYYDAAAEKKGLPAVPQHAKHKAQLQIAIAPLRVPDPDTPHHGHITAMHPYE